MLTKKFDIGFLAVDVQNLYHSCKDVHGEKMKVDYVKLLKYARSFVRRLHATAYVINSPSDDNKRFIAYMKGVGYTVKSMDMKRYKVPQQFRKQYGEFETGGTNWDIGISLDIFERVSTTDAIFVASGDGDYVDVIHRARVQKPNLFVGVFAFRKSFNQKLLECTDFAYFIRQSDVFKQREKK